MSKRPAKDANEEISDLVAKLVALDAPKGVYEDALKRMEALKVVKGEKNPAAVALGRLGGLLGGKARAEKLSATERSKIAKKAAKARWSSKPKTT